MNHPLDRTRSKAKSRSRCGRAQVQQLDLFPVLLEQSNDEATDDLLTQRVKWSNASQSPIPKEARRVASSVFDLAAAPLKIQLQQADKPRKGDPVIRSRVILRDGGLTRIMIDERDTPEWQEREYQRRARQVLPPPPMSARTKSEKLKKMIGGK
jgi:hypothetical protein